MEHGNQLARHPRSRSLSPRANGNTADGRYVRGRTELVSRNRKNAHWVVHDCCSHRKRDPLLKFDDQTPALCGSGCQAMAAMLRAWMEGAERVSAWQLNMIASTMTGNAHTTNLLGSWLGFSQWGDRYGQPDLRAVETGPGLRGPVEDISGENEPVAQSLKKRPNGSASPHPTDNGLVHQPGRVPLILVPTAAAVSEGRGMGEWMQSGSAQE